MTKSFIANALQTHWKRNIWNLNTPFKCAFLYFLDAFRNYQLCNLSLVLKCISSNNAYITRISNRLMISGIIVRYYSVTFGTVGYIIMRYYSVPCPTSLWSGCGQVTFFVVSHNLTRFPICHLKKRSLPKIHPGFLINFSLLPVFWLQLLPRRYPWSFQYSHGPSRTESLSGLFHSRRISLRRYDEDDDN